MNEKLGEMGTVDFTRVLDKLNVEYHFIPFGLELRENAKLNYYDNVMNKIIVQNLQTFNTTYNHNNRNLSVGKEEKEGWLRNL